MADDDRGRISGYLLGQGQKRTWLELWPRVIAGRLELLDAVADVSPAQGDFRSAPADWTIREVAHHVLSGSRAVAATIAQLANGDEAGPLEWTDPAQEPARASLGELRRALLADSVTFSSLATQFPDDVSLQPTAPHPFFGPLHCRAWFLFQRIHDQDHARQVQAIKSAQGYPV